MADTVHNTLGITGKAPCDAIDCQAELQGKDAGHLVQAAACGDRFLQEQVDGQEIRIAALEAENPIADVQIDGPDAAGDYMLTEVYRDGSTQVNTIQDRFDPDTDTRLSNPRFVDVSGQQIIRWDVLDATGTVVATEDEPYDRVAISWSPLTLPLSTTVSLPAPGNTTNISSQTVTATQAGFLEAQINVRVFATGNAGSASSAALHARLSLIGAVSTHVVGASVDQVDSAAPVGSTQSASGLLRVRVPVSQGDVVTIALDLIHDVSGYQSVSLATDASANNFYEFSAP